MNPVGPPRRAVAWLAHRLRDCPLRDSILGDLDEEHAAMTRRRSRLAAHLWYWRQAIALPRDRNSSRLNIPGSTPLIASYGRGLMSELRLAIRSAVSQPAHTLLVVLALALGLGLNAAVYGMGDALLFRPFPIPGIDRIVVLGEKRPGEFGSLDEASSPANFRDWKAAGGPFTRMAAWEYWDANLTGGSEPERVQAFRVSPGFFQLMGSAVTTGREFADGEDVPGNDRLVVLSEGLWKRRFGADPSLVGKTVQMEGHPYTVLGIAAAGFAFPSGTEAWVPLAFSAEDARLRRNRYLTVVASLREGATLNDARAHMAVVSARLKKDYPAENGQYETYVQTVAEGLADPGLGNLMMVWQASAVLVLLIACGNVAGLLLARGAARAREMAVRLAIGASRWRLIRQLLLESLLLAVLAIPLSLGLAWWMLRVLKSYMPARIASFVLGWNQIDLDGRVVGFTIVAAVVTTVIFGLLPALQSSSLATIDTLKEGGRGNTGGRLRLRKALVTAEIALALPLLVAAGMTALGTYRFINGPQGYDTTGLLTFRTSLPESTYPTGVERARFAEAVQQALVQVPGVTHAASMNIIPASNSGWWINYEIDGEPARGPDDAPLRTDYRLVSPGYFDTMSIPIVRGRGFNAADTRASQMVTIISESFARKHWPGQDPIGKRIVIPGRNRVVATIIGTSGDVTHDWFNGRNMPTLYRPVQQAASQTIGFAVRTQGDPASLASAARAALAKVDPNQPLYQVSTQDNLVWERTIGPQYAAGMMALFGALALLLSVIGIYALVGYYVTQRRQEIGVRMALGAQRRDVVRLTLRQAGVMAACGVGIGSVAAFALSRVLESATLGIAQSDPRLFAVFAAILGLSALAAGYLPARRAASIDPMIAIRND